MLSALIRLTRPLVQRVARAYDIRVDMPLTGLGQHPLILLDRPDVACNNIPAGTFFNTRSGSITVGRNTVFGEGVSVLTGKHMDRFEAEASGVEHHHVPESGRDIVIGDGCFVGSGVCIIGPVTIGDNVVIGAGAVVTKDVPADHFAAGVPAKVVRRLTPSPLPDSLKPD